MFVLVWLFSVVIWWCYGWLIGWFVCCWDCWYVCGFIVILFGVGWFVYLGFVRGWYFWLVVCWWFFSCVFFSLVIIWWCCVLCILSWWLDGLDRNVWVLLVFGLLLLVLCGCWWCLVCCFKVFVWCFCRGVMFFSCCV